jgi:hypothetical protein
MRSVGLGQRILSGQQPFCRRTVTLSFAVFLESVRDGDGSVAQVLPVHGFDGCIRGLETGVVDEGESLGVARIRIALYLGRGENDSEGGEGVIEQLLVDLRVEVPDKDVGSHVQVLLVGRGFVHSAYNDQDVYIFF